MQVKDERPIVVWIFCLSADKDGILEDTVMNIQAGMDYLEEAFANDEEKKVAAIMLAGDIRLQGKDKTVPEMMLEYIKKYYRGNYDYFAGKFILETQSLTSRENIPMGLDLLWDRNIHPSECRHVLCSERLHLRVLDYLLYYWALPSGSTGKLSSYLSYLLSRDKFIRWPSAQKTLGWRGRLRRMVQPIHVAWDPEGKSRSYTKKLEQRSKYLENQT